MKPVQLIYAVNNKRKNIVVLSLAFILALFIIIPAKSYGQASGNGAVIRKVSITPTIANGATITWSAAANVNCPYFLIERAPDSVHYEFVSEVRNNGNEGSTNFYLVNDNNLFSGKTFYRITETDYKGNTLTLYNAVLYPAEILTQK